MRTLEISLLAGLTCSLLGACSSRDLADMENKWPDLSDIAGMPADAASPRDHDAIIKALREEAELRKSEGYQAPEAARDEVTDANNN